MTAQPPGTSTQQANPIAPRPPVIVTWIGPMVAFIAILITALAYSNNSPARTPQGNPAPTSTPVISPTPTETPSPVPTLGIAWQQSGDIFDPDTIAISNGALYGITYNNSANTCKHPQVGSCFYLTALNAETGEKIWSLPDYKYPPAISNGTIYTGIQSEYAAIDLDTQQVKWTFAAHITQNFLRDDAPRYPPAIAQGVVYIANGNVIFAVDEATGKEKWHASYKDMISSPPLLAYSLLYLTADKGYGLPNLSASYDSGTLSALNIENGEQRWEYKPTGYGALMGDPVASTNYRIVVTNDATGNNDTGFVTAIDSLTGQVVWKQSPPGDYNRFVAVPALGNGNVYVVDENKGLYAYEMDAGKPIWQYSTLDLRNDQPVVLNKHVYVLSISGTLHKFDAYTGEHGQFRTLDHPVQQLISADGRLFLIGNQGGEMYSLSLPK